MAHTIHTNSLMKRILLTCAAVGLASAAFAAEFTEGLYTFNTTSETTVELTKVGKAVSYEIPETVENGGVTYTVTSIGENAFKWSDATYVALPPSIESIGYGAFNSAAITSIVLPEGLKTIGDYAFSSSKLTSLQCPSTLESIGYSAFFTCTSLTSVTLNEGLKTIGVSAFYKDPITEIEIPSTVTELSNKVFLMCPKLKTVKLHDGITSLGDGVFHSCTSLVNVNIPASIKSIGDECFLNTAITEVKLPASLETLGTGVFAASKVGKIELDNANTNFTLVDGVLYDSAKRLLYQAPMTGMPEVVVDPSCIGINGGAFWGSETAKVVLPEGMLAIDAYAFCQSSLAEINLPAGMTYIGEQAFAATKLTSVTFPENMTLVQDGVLAGCTDLTSVVIPSAVTLIYNHAFHNDTKLASVTCLGSTAPEIDDVYDEYDSPFFNVPSTAKLYIPKGTLASYKAAGWSTYFVIEESAQGSVGFASITPADGAVLGKSAAMKVEITFNSGVTIVENAPAVYLRKGSEISGAVIEAEDSWKATKGGDDKTVIVWASDYDGYTQYFTPEEDAEYYLTIPAGMVKDTDGNPNDRIVVMWHGPAAPKALEVVSTTPESGTVVTDKYLNMDFYVTFADNVTVLDYGPDVKLRKDNAVDGALVQPDDAWKVNKEADNKIQIWGKDYDGYMQSFSFDPAAKYYVVIPAGIVKNDNGDKNEEIVIELIGSDLSAIGSITMGGDAVEVGRYDLNGRPVKAGSKGVCIIKMSDGTVRKAVIK